MSNLNRLLNLEGHRLEVWKTTLGSIAVAYANCEIKDGSFLVGIFGTGYTFYEAVDDYFNNINGKTLVFNACSSNRKEIQVLWKEIVMDQIDILYEKFGTTLDSLVPKIIEFGKYENRLTIAILSVVFFGLIYSAIINAFS